MIRGIPQGGHGYEISAQGMKELRAIHSTLRLMAMLAQPTTPKPDDLILPRQQLSSMFKMLGESLRTVLDGMTPYLPPTDPPPSGKPSLEAVPKQAG